MKPKFQQTLFLIGCRAHFIAASDKEENVVAREEKKGF